MEVLNFWPLYEFVKEQSLLKSRLTRFKAFCQEIFSWPLGFSLSFFAFRGLSKAQLFELVKRFFHSFFLALSAPFASHIASPVPCCKQLKSLNLAYPVQYKYLYLGSRRGLILQYIWNLAMQRTIRTIGIQDYVQNLVPLETCGTIS